MLFIHHSGFTNQLWCMDGNPSNDLKRDAPANSSNHLNKSKMKKQYLLIFSMIILIIGCSPTEPETTQSEQEATPAEVLIDYEKEEAAIMEVLAGESAAFWDKDYEKFASYWVQEDYIRTIGWWEDGGVTVVEGWEERSRRTQEHMATSPDANPTATQVIRDNINLRIFENVAWMTFDQYGEDTGDELMDMPGLSRETRIFEKIDGEWKIAYTGWLLDGRAQEEVE